MAGRKLVVENHHSRCGEFHQHLHLLGLAFANEGVGIGSVAVLQNFARAEAAGGFQESFQLLQGFVGSGLILAEGVGVQAHQDRPLLHIVFKIVFHSSSIGDGK